MTAIFIGKDGSMGYRHGAQYDLKSDIRGDMMFIKAVGTNLRPCPYSNLEAFLANWTIIPAEIVINNEWSDF